MDKLGYCCINQTLRKNDIYTSRSLIRRTFSMHKASELALQNCKDLLTILEWNNDNNINVFRIGSDLFPRITDKVCGYELEQLDSINQIETLLAQAGKFAYDNNIIVSCHPGPYTVLGSDNPEVVKGSIREIMYHTFIGNMLRKDAPNLQFHVNFHVGNKFSVESGDRFCKNFDLLPEEAQKMIIIENDDKANCWSVSHLYDHIYKNTGIPITFDCHHSKFSRSEYISALEEFYIAKQTWSKNVLQEVHYSSSDNDNPKHSDYILEEIPEWLINDPDIYILLEAKEKELAVMDYRRKYLNIA
jgi:UV DNA damage endonuclease